MQVATLALVFLPPGCGDELPIDEQSDAADAADPSAESPPPDAGEPDAEARDAAAPEDVAGEEEGASPAEDATPEETEPLPPDDAGAPPPPPARGVGTWIWGMTLGEVGAGVFADEAAAAGFTDVFLLVKGGSGTVRLTRVDDLVAARDAAGYRFRIHAWIICFSDETRGGWVDPASASYRAYLLDEVVTPLLRDHRPDGINLDCLRYPGTADGRTEPITSFTQEVRARIDAERPGTLLSAAVMPEMGANAAAYGQDYAALAGPLDVLAPMAYTSNYRADAAWVGTVTGYVLGRAAGAAEVWPALQSLNDVGEQMTGSRLQEELRAAQGAGATGASLFRYPHTSSQLDAARTVAW